MTTDATDPDAAAVYEEIGPNGPRWVYRASALGNCQNALACARRGITGSLPPEELQKRFDVGKEMEAVILNRLHDRFQFQLYGHQSTVELDLGPKVVIRGHVDALTAGSLESPFEVTHVCGQPAPGTKVDGGVIVTDAKALAPSGVDKWLKENWSAFPYYLWQQAFYTLIPGFDAVVMAIYNKLDGDMIVDLWPASDLPITKVDIIRRVTTIETIARDGKMFEEACSPRQFPCPFWRMHPIDPAQTFDKKGNATDVDMQELNDLADLLADAKARGKQAKQDEEDIEKRVEALFGGKEATGESSRWKLTTYHHGYSTVQWDDIANAAGLENAEAARDKFNRHTTSTKMSVKLTDKEKKK